MIFTLVITGIILFFLFYNVILFYAVYKIIINKGDPIRTVAWLMVVLLIPFFGLFLYFFIGRNIKKEKLFDRKKYADNRLLLSFSKDIIFDTEKIFNPPGKIFYYHHEYYKFIRLLSNKDHSKLTTKNEVTILNNGHDTYAAIINELKNAKSSIHMEYYLFEEGRIGNIIKDILIQKAKEGIEVRFMYDDVGSWGLKNTFIRELRQAGVKTFAFMPVKFPQLTSRINYRNHKKILIIDGRIGFMGGINISDKYVSEGELGFWRDTHICIKGEAVKNLQKIFLVDWIFLSEEKISNQAKYFPPVTIKNTIPLQVITSGPDSERPLIMEAFFAAISNAKKSIHISTPYFLPNNCILQALRTASLSGVPTKMILPFYSDSKFVHYGSMSYVDQLLDANVKVYLYKKGFIHSKILVIDGAFSSVGTANMDFRSFEHNLEVNAFVYDTKIAEELTSGFYEDLGHCVEIKKAAWEKRPRIQKHWESVARIFAPLL
jgi:cardiolipin synthase A/B